jgi:hypothetical protein
MSEHAKHPLDFWHFGDGEEFFDVAQWERWVATARAVEDGDANAIIDFLLYQNGKPILPGLRSIIKRLTSGEPFPRDDGYLLRLDPLAPHREKGGLPPFGAPDPLRADLIYHAGGYAYDLIEQGVAKTEAYEKTIRFYERENFKLTVDEVRESCRQWKRMMEADKS